MDKLRGHSRGGQMLLQVSRWKRGRINISPCDYAWGRGGGDKVGGALDLSSILS